MTRVELLDHLDKAWQALLASYAGLSETEITEIGVTEAWSVKDIIAHITAWENEALKHLPTILAGKRPPRYSVLYGGIDAFNAQVVEQSRSLSLAEVLERRDETHQRLIDYIMNAPENQFQTETRFRHRLRLDTYSHYPQHAEAIRKWRELRSR
jgi:hypothetical protein